MHFPVNKYADTVASTLSLDPHTPPYSIIASALINNQGKMGAYINASGTLVLANGQTLQSTLTLNDPTTPSITLAAGSTNTGTITINGKTSGATVITTADATAQTLTIKTAAQTVGAATLAIPNFASVNDTFAFVTLAQTLANKTLSGLLTSAPNVQTGSTYSVVATDVAITANASGTLTLTLGTATAGRTLFIRTIAAQTVVSASSNVSPVAGTSASTAILAGTAGKWAILQGDGTVWQTLAAN